MGEGKAPFQVRELLGGRARVTEARQAAGAHSALLFGSVVDAEPGRAPRGVDLAVSVSMTSNGIWKR